MRDFFDGTVNRQGKPEAIESFDESGADNVDSNGTKLEDKGAVGVSPVGLFGRQVDIFYYGDFAVDETEIADFFCWAGFDKCL